MYRVERFGPSTELCGTPWLTQTFIKTFISEFMCFGCVKKYWFRDRIIHTSGILASKSQRSAWSSCAFSLRFPECFPVPRPSCQLFFSVSRLGAAATWSTLVSFSTHHCNSFMTSVVRLPIGTYLYLTGYGVWFGGFPTMAPVEERGDSLFPICTMKFHPPWAAAALPLWISLHCRLLMVILRPRRYFLAPTQLGFQQCQVGTIMLIPVW